MADRNDAPSSMISHNGAAARTHSTAGPAGEQAGSVVTEFFDAARSAAESMLDDQKTQIAERVSGMAEALRGAVQSLERSQNRMVARYLDQAAGQVESFSRTVRDRRWSELVADTEDFARRQPTLFVLGAVATGFVVGRMLWTATGGQRHRDEPNQAYTSRQAARAVTAAVSSAPGEPAGADARPSGAAEAG